MFLLLESTTHHLVEGNWTWQVKSFGPISEKPSTP